MGGTSAFLPPALKEVCPAISELSKLPCQAWAGQGREWGPQRSAVLPGASCGPEALGAKAWRAEWTASGSHAAATALQIPDLLPGFLSVLGTAIKTHKLRKLTDGACGIFVSYLNL